jgi:hypothetical protein
MIATYAGFPKLLFKGLSDYSKYVKENQIDKLLGISMDEHGDASVKSTKPPFYSVNSNLMEAFPAEFDDLSRLHFLVRSRKVTTVLEFGLGKSSVIFDDALKRNASEFENYVEDNLRRTNRFECFSVDNYQTWIDEVKTNYKTDRVNFHYSSLVMGLFNGRICTYYSSLPNVCPDLIYLDGPDQFSPEGDVRGITTNHPDRLPMSADILAIEHFLLPGTLIITDGRTANARFLRTNLQRDWLYCHDSQADQHYFELAEKPLGVYNERQIKFCLGDSFFERLKEFDN